MKDEEIINTIAAECTHGTRLDFCPFVENENDSYCDNPKWRCDSILPKNFVFPIAELETDQMTAPMLEAVFKKANIFLGKRARDLLATMVELQIPFSVNIFHHGFNITIKETMD